ncbi:MAG TPA: hypothetical protein VIO80_03680 [Candidatus Dormibacteraeota bacterium]
MEGLTARTKRSPAIASPPSLYQLKALSVKMRLLWPAGVALVIALGVAVAVPVAVSQRVWIAFFAIGTILTAILAPVLAIDPRTISPVVIRVGRGLALGLSGFALGVGIVHAASYHWEAIAALVQVLVVVITATVTHEPWQQGSAAFRIGSVLLWAALSLAAWGVAGSLLWWGFSLGHLWALAVLASSVSTVAGALWRPDAVANRLVRWAGTGVALAVLAVASFRTIGPFNLTNMNHWEFYVGPAELVRQGGWLLWDVPSQYGFLSELTIAWMPTSSPWEGLFILNSLMCFLLATTVFVLLRSLGRGILNLFMSFIVALVACLIRPGVRDGIVGPNGYPSTGAFRFLWCVVLLLILVTLLRVSASRARLAVLLLGNVVWVVGVLWSAESAIYSTFVWLPGYFLMLLAERWSQANVRRRILSIGLLSAVPVLLLAAALAIVLIVYQIGLGHGPDLRSFYEFGLTYQAGFGAYPIDPGGPGWLLFLAFATTLVTLMWNARKQPALASIVLVATAALIYSTSSYFVGRSHPNNVWNLAPQICIALAVTLALADRHLPEDPLPRLLRLVAAPVLIIFLLGALGDRAAVMDWVTRPQDDIAHIDTALKATDPSLQTLLAEHAHPGDRIAYLAAGSDPVLSPHLYTDIVQPNGAPLWLPLAPFAEINILPRARGVLYLERFIAKHPEGGWLIEPTGPRPQDGAWVLNVIAAHFTPGPTYSNGKFQLTFWRPKVGSR